MKPADYIQSDDFAQMEMGDKIDYLSDKSPSFKKLPVGQQRDYIMTKTKQPTYKSKDLVSKALNFGLPLAGQYGGEALAGAGGILGAPETGGASLAAALAGGSALGGAGAAFGESASDYIDYKRGMGPKPSMKSELKAAPKRALYGGAGSLLGMANPTLVNPKTMEGAMVELGNPRLYTRAIRGIEEGMGKKPAIEAAARTGEESIAKYQADAENKLVDASKAIKKHAVEKGYKDPVLEHFEDVPMPKVKEFKNFGEYQKAFQEWTERNPVPKKTSMDLDSLWNRTMQLKRNQGKIPVEQEVPQLLKLKQDFQHKLWQGSAEPGEKLPKQDWRDTGKAIDIIDKRIREIDPKYADLHDNFSKASQELEERASNPIVKKMAGVRGEDFTNRFARIAKRKAPRGQEPGGLAEINQMKGIEKESGIPFTDKLTQNLAAEHFKRPLADNSSMWQRRMGIAAPLVIGGALASGKLPPSYLSAMSLLAMMLSPALAKQMVTTLPRYGPEALSQFARSLKEPERE